MRTGRQLTAKESREHEKRRAAENREYTYTCYTDVGCDPSMLNYSTFDFRFRIDDTLKYALPTYDFRRELSDHIEKTARCILFREEHSYREGPFELWKSWIIAAVLIQIAIVFYAIDLIESSWAALLLILLCFINPIFCLLMCKATEHSIKTKILNCLADKKTVANYMRSPSFAKMAKEMKFGDKKLDSYVSQYLHWYRCTGQEEYRILENYTLAFTEEEHAEMEKIEKNETSLRFSSGDSEKSLIMSAVREYINNHRITDEQ